MIIDTHAHYDSDAFQEDRDSVLSALQEAGVGIVVNSCASISDLDDTIALMDQYDFIYGSVGIHPDDADQMTPEILEKIRIMSRHPKAVAIGEIGLDYYWHKLPEEHEVQKKWFLAQLELAREEDLPFLIHSRDAAEDTLKIIKEAYKQGSTRGVIHCFSYSPEIAREYLQMGYYLGIGGVVTFQNAKKLKEVVRLASLDQLLLETDCPYLAPAPNRGKRNDSRNLIYVAKMIAELKEVSIEEVLARTEANARRIFQFK